MKNIEMGLSPTKEQCRNENKLQPFNSFQFHRSPRSSQLRFSSRQDVTPSPDVDTDITILNETPKEKADRLLQEANKRDIALMATSSRATTRYAALYAASKNRGLDASLERNLTNLEAVKNKKVRMIQKTQETVKDDFKKTKKVSLRREKQFVKYKSESYIYEKRKTSCDGHCRYVKLPPIHLRKMNSL